MSDKGGGYFSRSSALLKRDKGWIKLLLVLGVSMFVPVVGQLGVEGYALEWARLTAWGCDSSPKQKNVQVGQCIKSGWRGFVSIAGWAAIFFCITWLLTWLTQGNDILSGIVGTLLPVAGVFVGVLEVVCQVRAAVYQDFKAGYQVNRIMDMLKRDFKGIARIVGMTLLMSLVMGVVATVLAVVIVVPSILGLVGASYGDYYMSERMVISQVMQTIMGMVPLFVLYFYVCCVACAYVKLITDTAVALWMRQFNVPMWGASADPLPPEQPAFAPAAGAYGAQPQGGQGQLPPVSYQQPTQDQGAWQQPTQQGYQPPAQQSAQWQQPTQQAQWQQPQGAAAPVGQAPFQEPAQWEQHASESAGQQPAQDTAQWQQATWGAGQPVTAPDQQSYQPFVPQEAAPAAEPVQQVPYELPAQAAGEAPATQEDQAWQQAAVQPQGDWQVAGPSFQADPGQAPAVQQTASAAQQATVETPMPSETPASSVQPAPAPAAPAPETVVPQVAQVQEPTVAEAQPQQSDADHRGVSPLGDLKPVEVKPSEPLAPVNLDVPGETKDDSQQ